MRRRELSPALYEAWGRALGRQLPPAAKFVVGGDVRESTPPFLAALVDGLCQAGLDVVDLGLLPTPMIYYAKRRLHADGCAIVTASHNPATINGLKWMLGDRPPTPDDVAALERAVQSPNVLKQKGRAEGDGHDRTRTEPRTLDISFDYVACLQETFVESLTAQRHIVLDPMFGCWAGKARRYLHAIFPQCLFSTIHDAVDAAVSAAARPTARAPANWTICARPSTASGPIWASPSTATATASPWSTTKASPCAPKRPPGCCCNAWARSCAASGSSTT